MKHLRRIGIVGGARLPFARTNTEYLHKSNFDMLAATLKGIADRFGLSAEPLGEVAAGAVVKHTRDSNLTRDSVIAAGLHPQTPAYDVQQACGAAKHLSQYRAQTGRATRTLV